MISLNSTESLPDYNLDPPDEDDDEDVEYYDDWPEPEMPYIHS
jgi:hypothetical protein